MAQIKYKYGKKTIEATIKYSERKTIDLRVFPEGNVEITAPLNTAMSIIMDKVKLKSKWVIDQQKTFELYRPFTSERLYVSGETHRYLGRQYKLSILIKDDIKTSLKLSKGLFLIETTKITNVEKIIKTYYKERADVIFKELLQKLLNENPQFKSFDFVLSHRILKKRWGSCSTCEKILLNTELIKASKQCIEYVILHELCHLIHPNHSKDFYNLLNELLPDWERIKAKLERDLA